MNRQERRRLEREGANKAELDKQKKDDIYEQGYHIGMQHAIEITYYMTAYTLNYKLGFGRKRLIRMMRWIYENIDSFRTGHLSRFDFNTIKADVEKMGVKLK